MVKAKVYNQTGEETGEIKLNPSIFEVEVKEDLVKQAIQYFLGNNRHVIANTKDRSEVRGGGKKPWKQKGTGRARHGSSRSPLWIGGGVTFGPTNERNFTKNLNKKMRRKAVLMVLSDKAKNESILILESLKFEKAKTKEMAVLVKKLNVKSAMFITENNDENIYRSVRNLTKINFSIAESMNVYDLVKSDKLIMTKEALKKIEAGFTTKEEK